MIAAVAAVFAVSLLGLVFCVWPAMLLFGAVHTFWPAVPALSFGQTVVVAALVKFLTMTFEAK